MLMSRNEGIYDGFSPTGGLLVPPRMAPMPVSASIVFGLMSRFGLFGSLITDRWLVPVSLATQCQCPIDAHIGHQNANFNFQNST